MMKRSSNSSDRKILKIRRERSKSQEAKLAKQTGGRTTIASGALCEKSDVVSPALNLRFEAKRTDKKQITLRKVDVDKIIFEAYSTGMVPGMHLEIDGTCLFVFPEHFALELLELWKKSL